MLYIWQPDIEGCIRIATGDQLTMRFCVSAPGFNMPERQSANVEVNKDGEVKGLNKYGKLVVNRWKENNERQRNAKRD